MFLEGGLGIFPKKSICMLRTYTIKVLDNEPSEWLLIQTHRIHRDLPTSTEICLYSPGHNTQSNSTGIAIVSLPCMNKILHKSTWIRCIYIYAPFVHVCMHLFSIYSNWTIYWTKNWFGNNIFPLKHTNLEPWLCIWEGFPCNSIAVMW